MSETQPDQGWTKNGQPQEPEPVIQPTVRVNAVPDVIRRAADEVARLCAGRGRVTRSGLAGRDWTMCIPRRDDDSDEVFSDLIEAAAKMERDYIAVCSERDALAMHPLREAVDAFLAKHPAQIGSKSGREDYGGFVSAADLWALHLARRGGAA